MKILLKTKIGPSTLEMYYGRNTIKKPNYNVH